jgi:uncharacterized membrane protein
MNNRNVGFLIVGIALLIGLIVFFFNKGMTDIVNETCSHGPECSMYDTINFQTNLSLIIAGLVLLIGLFLIFSKENERVVIQKVKEKAKKVKIDLKGLDETEKKVITILQREGGAVFQRSLMEELEIGKVKMTRMADKLEAKQIIERKRRGMNNILVLKGN